MMRLSRQRINQSMEILHREENNYHAFHEVSIHEWRILLACASSCIVSFNYQRGILCSIFTSSGTLVGGTTREELTLLWWDWCSISTFFLCYKITERNRLIESCDNVASFIVCNTCGEWKWNFTKLKLADIFLIWLYWNFFWIFDRLYDELVYCCVRYKCIIDRCKYWSSRNFECLIIRTGVKERGDALEKLISSKSLA